MARIKSLGFFQKVVLAVVLAMAVVFTVVYAVTTARVGFSYKDAILVPAQEGGATVYTGKVQGKNARITVDPDEGVTFQYDDKTFGPYTVQEDPTAIPEAFTENSGMTGIEALREIKGYNPAIPVLIMTAYSNVENAVISGRDSLVVMVIASNESTGDISGAVDSVMDQYAQ